LDRYCRRLYAEVLASLEISEMGAVTESREVRQLAVKLGNVLLREGNDEINDLAVAFLVKCMMQGKAPPRYHVWEPVTRAICRRFRDLMCIEEVKDENESSKDAG